MKSTTWAIRVPASSANLGPGFDVLGMALSLYATVGIGDPPIGAVEANSTHPATVAYQAAGGHGRVWVRSAIPMGRGLGFSGSVRVGGAAAAVVERIGVAAWEAGEGRDEVLDVSARLEGHADNAAPSLFGGVTVAVDTLVRSVPLALDPAVVAWIPDQTTTSTDHSRATLATTLSMEDAVFNIGRVGLAVVAWATGDHEVLRVATEDRLHQDVRLAAVPATAAALTAAVDAGAWAAWLSGSGPTMAAVCPAERGAALAAALPGDGHTKVLSIDTAGAVVVDVDAA